MKKIIVFGATGNLGAYIAMHMKSQGYDVIAVGGRKDDHNSLQITECVTIL